MSPISKIEMDQFKKKLKNSIVKLLSPRVYSSCKGRIEISSKLAFHLRKKYNIKGIIKHDSPEQNIPWQNYFLQQMETKRYFNVNSDNILNFCQIKANTFKMAIRKGKSISYYDSSQPIKKTTNPDYIFSFYFTREDIVEAI